jgi:hypothetical protein
MMVASCLQKMLKAQLRSVPLISDDCCYLSLLKDSWEWRRGGEVKANLQISFGVPDSQISTFRILRHFQSGKGGSVILVMAEELCLAVLKIHFEEGTRCKEVQLWQTLYDVKIHSADLLQS